MTDTRETIRSLVQARLQEVLYRGEEKFHGHVPEVTHLPHDIMKPSHQYERNGALSSLKNSGKSPQDWAKSVDLSEPADVSLFSDGDLRIEDGHHRHLAAEILGKNLPVKLTAINAKAADIHRLIHLSGRHLEGRYPHKVPKVAQPPTATNLDYIPSTLRKKRRRAPMDKLVNNNGQYLRVNEPRK